MSAEDVELGTLLGSQQQQQPPEKCTRFQVNRVQNDSERKYEVNRGGSNSHGDGVGVHVVSTDEGETTDDENHVESVTDRTRLNSESDAKYGKSFR